MIRGEFAESLDLLACQMQVAITGLLTQIYLRLSLEFEIRPEEHRTGYQFMLPSGLVGHPDSAAHSPE